MTQSRGLSRRQTFTGLTAVGVGVPLLAACGTDEGPATTATDENTQPAGDGTSNGGAGEQGLASTDDIPVGGGTIFPDEQVVVTQPSAGEFKAFSGVCTHQGCLVSGVTDTIDCSCHGSRFDLADGSVTSGPASSPLGEVGITVEGGQITLA